MSWLGWLNRSGGRTPEIDRAAGLSMLVDAAEQMAHVGRWRNDLRTGFVIWSDEVFRICGLKPSPTAPSPESTIQLFHPDDRDRLFSAFKRCCESGVGYEVETRLISATGGMRRVISKGEAERDGSGRVVAVHGVFVDVTALRRADERRQESETRYRQIAEYATDMMFEIALDSTILSVTPACLRVLGRSPESLIGVRTLELTHPDDLVMVKSIFRDLIAAGADAAPITYAFRAAHAHKRWIWLEGQPRIRFDEHGQASGLQDVVRDITARKQAEADLVAAREAAEVANIAKADFLANMSHELRTPLTSVIGFASLLEQSDDLGDKSRGYAGKISIASNALLALINDVLDFSKLEAGALELEVESFAPSQVIGEAVDMIRPQADAKNLIVEVLVSERTPDLLLGDAARIRQVLLNLLSNAVKFTAEGKISVVVKSEALGHGTRLQVAVTDTGIGISSQHSAKLFERFVQADGGVARRFGGTGLGLSISRRLLELMNGQIGVESREGMGSTFWFTVDLEPALEARLPPSQIAWSAAGRRVLVVDDHDVNRELVRMLLQPLGCAVDTVADGPSAVEAVRAVNYDLVLMDVQMPGMDGVGATRHIRMLSGRADLPILAMTANVFPEQVARYLASGMDGHVGKPLIARELSMAVAQWTDPEARSLKVRSAA